MSVERNLYDDESDMFYYTSPSTGQVYRSDQLSDLTFAERKRLQRHDPNRPWLVDGAMPRVHRTPLTNLRLLIYTRDGFRCQQCGSRFISEATLASADFEYDGLHNIHGLTLGHIIPRSKGGTYDPENIKAQCSPCNNRLGDNVWTEFI